MTATVKIAPVRKSIRVNASRDHAFEVFTSGLGRWWPRKATIGQSPLKMAVMEPRLGGRWYELGEDGSQTDVGKVLVWEPPQRFVISWDINSNWQPDTTVSSEVEVRFIAEGADATVVELERRKFERLGAEGGASCARMSMAAGLACWSTSSAKPRPKAHRHWAASTNVQTATEITKGARARFDVTRWQFWDLAHWDPACAVFAYEYVVKPFVLRSGEPDMAAVAKGTEAFHRVGKVLDGQLKGKPFVTGDTLTVADFSLGAAMKLADIAHYPIETYGEIKRWYGTLSALPAWQKTLAQTAMPAASAA